MKLGVERPLLLLQLLSKAFVLCQLLAKLVTLMLILLHLGMLTLHELDLLNEACENSVLRTNTLPSHLFFHCAHQISLLLLKLDNLLLQASQSHLSGLLYF